MGLKNILAGAVVTLFGVVSVNSYAHQDQAALHNLFHSVGGSHPSPGDSSATSRRGDSAGGGGGGQSVPELDAAVGPLALALLGGVVAIGFEHRRRKNKRDASRRS